MRGYQSFKPNTEYIYLPDRLISCVSYLTFGFGGFIWLIIAHLNRKTIPAFTKFHIFQSIFLYILISVFYMVIGLIYNIIGIIPLLGNLIQDIIYFPTQFPLILGDSLFDLIRHGLYIYLPVMTLLGKYGKLPWISDTVKQMA